MEVQDAIDHYVSQQEDRARSELTSFLAKCRLDSAQLMLSPLKGSASAAISACAIEQEADLIVLGTNQRKGLERFLLGSVAQGVLLDIDSPVTSRFDDEHARALEALVADFVRATDL